MTGSAVAWRLSWRHPIVPRAIVVAFTVGALGGTIPTGFLVLPTGAGLGRGATWGLWAFAFAGPLFVPYAVSAICAARYEWQLDTDLFLAGQPQAVTFVRDALGALSVALSLTLPAAVGGAVVGAADAVARGSALWTVPSASALLVALAATGWAGILAALVATALRSATAGFCVVCGFFLTGIAAVGLADAQVAWDLIGLSPYGPFTLLGHSVVGARHGLETHHALTLIASVAWLGAIAWLVLRRQRGLPPKRPPATAAQ